MILIPAFDNLDFQNVVQGHMNAALQFAAFDIQ